MFWLFFASSTGGALLQKRGEVYCLQSNNCSTYRTKKHSLAHLEKGTALQDFKYEHVVQNYSELHCTHHSISIISMPRNGEVTLEGHHDSSLYLSPMAQRLLPNIENSVDPS